jgi:hypothetical protein
MLAFEPEPISAIIIAVSMLLTAMGIPALWRGIMSGKREAPEDKIMAALEANTAAQLAMLDQFKNNNGMFAGMGQKFDALIELTRSLERVQRDVHTEIVRQGK